MLSKVHILSLFFVLEITAAVAQVSPFNGRKPALNDADSSSLTFIVTGHLHGASYNQSGFPASTILGNLDTLNAIRPAFMISLGDLFPELTPQIHENYKKSLFSKLSFPLYNVVGNHDLGRGEYRNRFGRTYDYFIIAGSMFIMLDTEVDDGSIRYEQLKLFKEALEKAKEPSIKNVFISSHRPVWAEENPRYKDLFEGNTRTMIGSNNYLKEILPLVKEKLRDKNVFWFSGSLSAAPVSFFYDKDPDSPVTNIQTAVREIPRDAVLIVKAGDQVSFEGLSLTGQDLKDIQTYNIEFWKKNSGKKEGFNFRLLPYLTLLIVTHHYFWFGLATGILLFLVYFLLKRRAK